MSRMCTAKGKPPQQLFIKFYGPNSSRGPQLTLLVAPWSFGLALPFIKTETAGTSLWMQGGKSNPRFSEVLAGLSVKRTCARSKYICRQSQLLQEVQVDNRRSSKNGTCINIQITEIKPAFDISLKLLEIFSLSIGFSCILQSFSRHALHVLETTCFCIFYLSNREVFGWRTLQAGSAFVHLQKKHSLSLALFLGGNLSSLIMLSPALAWTWS